MQPPVRVTSFELIRDFEAALATFRADGLDAITAAQMEVRRMSDWLEDRRKFWQRAIRDRQEEVVQAKAALARKQIFLPGERPPDTTQEIKDLRRAVARLEEAEDKVEKTRRWEPLLRRAVEEYESPVRQLSAFLEVDLPKGLSLLERMLDSLDAYVNTAPKKAPPPSPSKPETPS